MKAFRLVLAGVALGAVIVLIVQALRAKNRKDAMTWDIMTKTMMDIAQNPENYMGKGPKNMEAATKFIQLVENKSGNEILEWKLPHTINN